MSRKGAETQRDAHWFALTRWENDCLLASASSLRLCAFARHPIAGFRIIKTQRRRAGRGSRRDALKLPAPFNAGTSSLCGSLKSPLRLCVRNTPYHRTLNRPGRDPREIGITWMKKRRTTDFTDDSQKGNSSIRVIREIRGSSSPSSAFIRGSKNPRSEISPCRNAPAL